MTAYTHFAFSLKHLHFKHTVTCLENFSVWTCFTVYMQHFLTMKAKPKSIHVVFALASKFHLGHENQALGTSGLTKSCIYLGAVFNQKLHLTAPALGSWFWHCGRHFHLPCFYLSCPLFMSSATQQPFFKKPYTFFLIFLNFLRGYVEIQAPYWAAQGYTKKHKNKTKQKLSQVTSQTNKQKQKNNHF